MLKWLILTMCVWHDLEAGVVSYLIILNTYDFDQQIWHYFKRSTKAFVAQMNCNIYSPHRDKYHQTNESRNMSCKC